MRERIIIKNGFVIKEGVVIDSPFCPKNGSQPCMEEYSCRCTVAPGGLIDYDSKGYFGIIGAVCKQEKLENFDPSLEIVVVNDGMAIRTARRKYL